MTTKTLAGRKPGKAGVISGSTRQRQSLSPWSAPLSLRVPVADSQGATPPSAFPGATSNKPPNTPMGWTATALSQAVISQVCGVAAIGGCVGHPTQLHAQEPFLAATMGIIGEAEICVSCFYMIAILLLSPYIFSTF